MHRGSEGSTFLVLSVSCNILISILLVLTQISVFGEESH